MNNRTLCNVFAQGTKEKGKGSNMFFEGNKIYSYGHHYLLAYRNHIEINGVVTRIAIRNDNGYSVTTAKHSGQAGGALSIYGYRVLDTKYINQVVYDIENTAHISQETKHLLAQEYSARIAGFEQRATKARKSGMIEFWLSQANEAREEREIFFSL